MRIFCHNKIPCPIFSEIDSIDGISKTPPNSAVLFDFDFDIATYCQKNGVKYAIRCRQIKEVIFSENLGASFVIVSKDIAKAAQDVADNYLFDLKIVAMISEESEIEELALFGIDCVMFLK